MISPSPLLPTPCFHCHAPVFTASKFRLDEDLENIAHSLLSVETPSTELCCAGCQAVANTILRNGLGEYYRQRRCPADANVAAGAEGVTTSNAPALPRDWQELSLFDTPETQAQFVQTHRTEDGTQAEAMFIVEGLRCGACVWLIEKQLRSVPGVLEAQVNYATERLFIRWDTTLTQLAPLLHSLDALGYPAYPFDVRTREAHTRSQGRRYLKRLFVAAMGMMQVMMYAYPAYVNDPVLDSASLDSESNWLMQWASLILTLPVMLYSAQDFFSAAWRDLRTRKLGMDVPVVLGMSAAFGGSVYNLWRGHGTLPVYFDSISMFVFLLLGARYLEWLARRQAARELDRLDSILPASCERKIETDQVDPSWETINAARLKAGDIIRVSSGQVVPADTTVRQGASDFNLAVLSGESYPVLRSEGMTVPAGSINLTHPIELRVTRAGATSSLAQMVRQLHQATLSKPHLAGLSERIAAYFIAGLLLFAGASYLYWWSVDPTRALPIAIAILVVSCPCALSLAIPAAQAAALGHLLQQGVLVMRGAALETLNRVTVWVFDKTGTLTTGQLQVQNVAVLDADTSTKDVLAIAAALEAGAIHPIAQAILTAASAQACSSWQAKNLAHTAGAGVEGEINGMRYRLGSAAFCGLTPTPIQATVSAPLSIADHHQNTASYGALYLVKLAVEIGEDKQDSRTVLARFQLSDTLRPETMALMTQIRQQGQRIYLLSGDTQAAVSAIAQQCGVTEFESACSPQDKLARVQAFQAVGNVVGMVGDGVNDALVLQAADVSCALANGAPIAQLSADIVWQRAGLHPLRQIQAVAAKCQQIMRQNLIWAMLYNLFAIPAAALGWVSPWMASIGMATSSLFVVLNALRLQQIPQSRLPQDE